MKVNDYTVILKHFLICFVNIKGDCDSALQINGILTGIVSFGQGCARRGVPEIYTSVLSVVTFIDSNLK